MSKIERRLGEVMEDERKAGKLKDGRPSKKRVADGPVLSSLADRGVDKHLADRARKAALISRNSMRGVECAPAGRSLGRLARCRGPHTR